MPVTPAHGPSRTLREAVGLGGQAEGPLASLPSYPGHPLADSVAWFGAAQCHLLREAAPGCSGLWQGAQALERLALALFQAPPWCWGSPGPGEDRACSVASLLAP